MLQYVIVSFDSCKIKCGPILIYAVHFYCILFVEILAVLYKLVVSLARLEIFLSAAVAADEGRSVQTKT